MSTLTGSVHLSSSTLDMEHRYDPPCSAEARSIYKYHNVSIFPPLFICLLYSSPRVREVTINHNLAKLLTTVYKRIALLVKRESKSLKTQQIEHCVNNHCQYTYHMLFFYL